MNYRCVTDIKIRRYLQQEALKDTVDNADATESAHNKSSEIQFCDFTDEKPSFILL